MTDFQAHTGKRGVFTLSHKAERLLGAKLIRVEATIASVTTTHVTLVGHADVGRHDACARCGLPIDHPVSLQVGFGPVCCEKLGIPRPSLEQLTAGDTAQVEQIRALLAENTRFEARLPLPLVTEGHLEDGTVLKGPKAVVARKGLFLLDYHNGPYVRFPEANLRGGHYYPATAHHARMLLTEGVLADEATMELAHGRGGEAVTTVITRDEDLLLISNPFRELEAAKSIPGRRWDPERGCNTAPFTAAAVATARQVFGARALYASDLDAAPAASSAPVAPEEAGDAWVDGQRIIVKTPRRVGELFQLPFHTWDKEELRHEFPAQAALAKLVHAHLPDGTRYDQAFRALRDDPTESVPRILVRLTGKTIKVTANFADKDTLKGIMGAKWNASSRTWDYPQSPETAATLARSFESIHPAGALDALLREHRARERAKLEAEALKEREDLPDIPGVKTQAWTHQRQAFHFARKLPGALLWMHMGTGKSLVTLGLIHDKKPRVTIAFAPKRALRVWPAEFAKHGLSGYRVILLDKNGTSANLKHLQQELKTVAEGERVVVVVNYEAAWRDELSKALKALKPEMIVADESHRIKGHKAKSSKFVYDLSRLPSVKFRLALSGTPLPHSPLDAFAQVRALDQDVFGTNYWQFEDTYGVKNRWGQVTHYRNLPDFNERLMRITYRADKDVLDLPPVMHQIVYVDLKPSTRRLCQQILDETRVQYAGKKITAELAVTKLLRLQQVTSGFITADDGTLEDVDPGKRQALRDLLEDFDRDEPIVVFATFHGDLDIIKETVEATGRTCAELSGRKDELQEFQDGKADVLAVQIRSGGAGVDLTRARYCIYFTHTWDNGSYEQSLDRVHRPGQERPVVYYHLIANNVTDETESVDERIYNALQAKQNTVKAVLEAGKQRKLAVA